MADEWTIRDGLSDLLESLLLQSLPVELLKRIEAFMDAEPDPENLSPEQQEELLGIVRELKAHDALHLIGLEDRDG